MAEYIKRESVLEFSRILDDQIWETGGYRIYPTEAVPVNAIRNIPSADVAEVKHGEWVNGKCSECGGDAPFWPMATTYYRSNFCPNCGAKMDGE